MLEIYMYIFYMTIICCSRSQKRIVLLCNHMQSFSTRKHLWTTHANHNIENNYLDCNLPFWFVILNLQLVIIFRKMVLVISILWILVLENTTFSIFHFNYFQHSHLPFSLVVNIVWIKLFRCIVPLIISILQPFFDLIPPFLIPIVLLMMVNMWICNLIGWALLCIEW